MVYFTTVSNSDCRDGRLVDNGLARMRKAAVVASFEALYRNMPGGTDGNE
jgi:hypothetical protein